MSLPIPNLDDRTYDDLMKESRSLIPRYNKEWTNFNPSDSGITLLELFSWLGEMVIYRINRVPEESYINFLRLIAGAPNKGDPGTMLKSSYIFNWNDFGRDEKRFRNFLRTELDIDWADNAKINKDDENKILLAFMGKNRVEIIINEIIDESEGKGYLKINGARTRYLHVVKKNGALNIYSVPDLDEAYKKLLTFLKEIEDGRKMKLTEIKEAPVSFMDSMYRVITAKDFEEKALDCMRSLLKIDPDIIPGRAICKNNLKLVYTEGKYAVNEELPGHVSVIIIPKKGENPRYCEDEGKPTDLLKEEVKAYLDARRLITTRVHVVSPVYNKVELRVQIVLKENTKEKEVVSEALKKIKEYFNPLTGGPDGTGWQLGRNMYRSELYDLLERIPDIDHVAKIWINGDEEVTMVRIDDYELISLPDPVVEKVNYE